VYRRRLRLARRHERRRRPRRRHDRRWPSRQRTGANHLVINEIDYDNVGSGDSKEYVEIFNPTGAAISLVGIKLYLVNGANNLVYTTVDLTSTITLIDAVSYGGAMTAVTIPGFTAKVSLVEGTAATAKDSNTVEGSFCRSPNGTDTDHANTDWKFCTTLTVGVANP
jgi:hypothetical protein